MKIICFNAIIDKLLTAVVVITIAMAILLSDSLLFPHFVILYRERWKDFFALIVYISFSIYLYYQEN